MLDPISAKIKLICRNNKLGKIIRNLFQNAEFPFNCLLRRKNVSNLNVNFFTAFSAYKIYLFVSNSADIYFISPSEHCHENDILKDQINIFFVISAYSFSQTMVSHIIFFTNLKNPLSNNIFQSSQTAVFYQIYLMACLFFKLL